MSFAEQIKGAADALGEPATASTGPSALAPPTVCPPPPATSPGPAASDPRSPALRKSGGDVNPQQSVPTAPAGQQSLSADLRSVQASLDRVQGDASGLSGGPIGATYNAERVLGSGAFGIVYQAKIAETNELVAIKKVLQDARFKNRELEIMQELKHPNIVELKSAFHVPGDKPKETYLNVVMEYCPETMHNLMSHYTKSRRSIPYELVQIYTYHMLRGVAYLTAKNICHRDIKPPNILIKDELHELKICDFGSAKRLSKGEPNVAYICSRYYRAPELIFGATSYSTLIDMWSVACVTAEMILQQVLFPGDSGVDQLMEIIKVLGTPSVDDLNAMNPVYGEFKFPQIKSYPWNKIFRSRTTPQAVDWLSKVLQYDPHKRPNGLQACMHKLFDDLRSPHFKTTCPLTMFWFSDEELALMEPEMLNYLVPEWVNVEQGGTVPRNLGLVQRPDVPEPSRSSRAPSLGDQSSASSAAPGNSTSAASNAPAESSNSGGFMMLPAVVEEKKEKRRSRKKDREEEEKEGRKEEANGEEKRPREGNDGYKMEGGDRPKRLSKMEDGEDSTRRRSPRPKKNASKEGATEGGATEGGLEPPSDNSPRRRKKSGEVNGKTPREDGEKGRKASTEENADGEGSPRREKRKGRERSEKKQEGDEAAASSTGAYKRDSKEAPAAEEGDALADFTHAMKKASGPPELTHAIAPSSSAAANDSGDAKSKTGGLPAGLLAGAGALQLVPTAATATALKER